MQTWTQRAIILGCVILVPLTMAMLPGRLRPHQESAPPSPSRSVAAAEKLGKVLPITRVADQPLTIDGDLTDWGRLDPRSGCIIEGIDDVPALASQSPKGAAVFSLRYDDRALYIAVRVLDSSVHPQSPVYMGDCIQLFLDVRPASGSGPKLGDHAYANGAYQWMIPAPRAGDSTVHWISGVQKVSPPGPFDIAEHLLTDGYTLEMRVPFTSLEGLSAERLSEPIGFDISVGDVNSGPAGAMSPRAEYSLSGSDDGWQDASIFSIAKADYAGGLPPPFVRPLPAIYSESTGSRRIVAGIIATSDATPAQTRTEIRYRGTGSDPKAVPPIERDEIREYPQLGIRAGRHTLEFQSMSRGRYEVVTHYPGLPDADRTTEFESVSWRRHPSMPRAARPAAAVALPDKLIAGSAAMRLPNGWRLTPAGRPVALAGDMPERMQFTPDGRYLFVSTGGYNHHGVTVIDASSDRIVEFVEVPKTWTGMAFDSKRGVLYLSGGGIGPMAAGPSKELIYRNAVLRFAWKNHRLARQSGINIPGVKGQNAFIGGLTVGRDGSLYVVNTQDDSVTRIDASLRPAAKARVGYRPNSTALSPSGRLLAVTNWGDRSVSILDARTLAPRKRIAVGSHPIDLAYAPDGRLFVTNAGSNSVSVILNGAVVETIKTSLDPRAPVGSTPVALAATTDRLYVANADNNSVAVIDIAHPGASRILGFIPTGWYPSALAVARDGKRLFIGTGKGLTFNSNGTGRYIGELLRGHVSVVGVPDQQQLARYTRQVVANVPMPPTVPAAYSARSTPFGKVKHVLFIIRENRTYDQVFGDLARGNGDPSLTLFGKDVTPNAHALAQEFVLLDNLYCNGEVSEDGHQWCNAAYATDFTERAWPNSYSDRGEPDADERLTASPAGYLWDNCARHGLSYYSYGEFAEFKATPNSPPVYNGTKGLGGHASLAWSQVSFDRHDTEKTRVFLSDLHRAESTGKWPNYMVMSLGEDHTQGTTPGKYTPRAHVASNDQALGQIVEAVSHSRFWPETAIMVIEDDAQDGPDHVDAHRTAGLVISPYVRRGVVDSTFYTTASFVHTMELMLGLPTMTQFDAAATPLTAAFMPKPNLARHNNLAPRVDMEARNGVTAPGAVASAKLDFSAYDRASPSALNHILWAALKPGVPYPAPVRSMPGLYAVSHPAATAARPPRR